MESIQEQDLHADLHTGADLEQEKKKKACFEKEGDGEAKKERKGREIRRKRKK